MVVGPEKPGYVKKIKCMHDVKYVLCIRINTAAVETNKHTHTHTEAIIF